MKKVVFAVSILLLLCFVIPAMGQTQLGVLAGLNLANISVEQKAVGVDYKTLTGFAFGGVASFGLGEMMMIQLEPNYIQKGTKLTNKNKGIQIKTGIMFPLGQQC